MYEGFFGLAEKPFAITPDPRYLFLGARHADALAHLVYGISHAGGFIQLTGEVGTGKTTTIRSLLARAPKDAEIALIINPRLTPAEFVQAICEELGIYVPGAGRQRTHELIGALNRHLLFTHAAGRRVVLIVDEAQNLGRDVLEELRLLTNLETESQKLLQIILIGQPELRELLAREDLRQLAQRVTARYHLDPLSREETVSYVRHRLRVAGATSDIFEPAALREVYQRSGGIPRVINVLCDRALLGAFTRDQHHVTARLVREAAREVFDESPATRWTLPAAVALGVVLLAGATLIAPRLAARLRHAPAAPAPRPAPVAIPAPAPPTLAARLAMAGSAAGPDAAFTQLLGLWHAKYAPGEVDGCTQARQQGLECVNLRVSLAELRELNRPAILMLSDRAGANRQVVITGISDDSVALTIGPQPAKASIGELSELWYGDLVMVWRPGVPVSADLRVGVRAPVVRRVRAKLLAIAGQSATGPQSDLYDAPLAHQVGEFQRQHHLDSDGIAKADTLILLDSQMPAPDTPVLRPPAPGYVAPTTTPRKD